MSLNLTTAKTFRQYAAVEGVNHPPVHPSFTHASPDGDAISPDATPAFTADATTDLLSTIGHGLTADTPILLSSTGTLPGGLSAGPLYVSASGLTADAFKVSATVGGSAINVTSAGTGTHTWQRSLTAAEKDQVDRWRLNRVHPTVLATPFIVDPATDLITSINHRLAADDTIQFTTTDTLPAGLSVATTYYVIASGLTADAFKVSATLGGSAIDVTDIGSGVNSWQRYLPVAVATITAWQTYEANPQHVANVIDDYLEREWQWKYRSADHADSAQTATPPSNSDSGTVTTSPPASPVNPSPN